MGLKTKAIIYYGFPFFNAWNSADDDSISSEEHNRLMGLVDEDDDSYPKQGTKNGEVALGRSGDLSGMEDEGEWHYVYIIGTFSWATFDTASNLDPRHMHLANDDWDAKLKAFCDEHGIPWQEPGWKLTVERS